MSATETGSYGRIPYVRIGDGAETVVVISGGNAFVRRFEERSALRNARQVARLFPSRYRLVILGYDSAATPAADVDTIAHDMAAVIREQFGAATIAAISFGGFVATRLAAEHPEVVRRLILISTAHRFSGEGRRRVREQIAAAARGDFVEMARPFLTLFRSRWRNALLRTAMWFRRRSFAEKMNAPAFIVSMLEGALAASGEAPAHLARVHAPTLLLGGTRDQFFDVAALQETAAAMPSATLVLFDNETHMLPLEQPHRVAAAIDRFLSDS